MKRNGIITWNPHLNVAVKKIWRCRRWNSIYCTQVSVLFFLKILFVQFEVELKSHILKWQNHSLIAGALNKNLPVDNCMHFWLPGLYNYWFDHWKFLSLPITFPHIAKTLFCRVDLSSEINMSKKFPSYTYNALGDFHSMVPQMCTVIWSSLGSVLPTTATTTAHY